MTSMKRLNPVDKMFCDSCSTKEDLITCSVCKLELCDCCFNKCMGNYISKNGIIHDNTHINPVTPFRLYIHLNLEDSKMESLNIYGMDHFVYAVRKSGYLSFRIFDQNKILTKHSNDGELFCKQTEFIPIIREFLDSLNYPEDFIDNIVKDLYNSSKEYKSITIFFFLEGGHILESDNINHLESPIIAWEGSSDVIGCSRTEECLKANIKQFKLDKKKITGNYTRTVEIYQIV